MDTTGLKQVIRSSNRTLDPQKDHAARSGNLTLDPQKRSYARPGVRTLDRLKWSFIRLCTQSLNTISRTIVKINVCTKICADARMSSTWNVSSGWWSTARPTKNRQRPDCSKNDASVKKGMFLAEHIFFEVPHHVPICVHLQAESAYSKTPVEHILQNIHHEHLHDKCMITVFCHQIIFVDNQAHKTNLATTHTVPQHYSILSYFLLVII